MMNYRNPENWAPPSKLRSLGERQGILTFTTSAVYGGLMAASYFAAEFGEVDVAKDYAEGAAKMRDAMVKYLYLPHEKTVLLAWSNLDKMARTQHDAAIDASLYGIFAFEAFPPDDPKVKSTMSQIFQSLE